MASYSLEPRQTVVSAPGKVLLAGGYLVLDRLYTGLVVATSSRFYCCVTPKTLSKSPSVSSNGESTTGTSRNSATITVRAGQFPSSSSTWSYTVSLESTASSPTLTIFQSNEETVGRNKFVEITLSKTLELAWEAIHAAQIDGSDDRSASGRELINRIKGRNDDEGLDVVVLGDNDFYSQREQLASASLPPIISSLNSLEPFCPLPRALSKTNKTGLGSSAALVTSLVGGLLSHLSIVSITPSGFGSEGLDLVHSLAQLAHCIAQGKVGSGFDVSSAVYGSHLYRRFSPSILTPLMSTVSDTKSTIPYTGTLLEALKSKQWDQDTISFRLPKGIRMMLADVDAGTDTPSFVGKVLTWRKENPEEALRIWTALSEANDGLRDVLNKLAERESDEGYAGTLHAAAKLPIGDSQTDSQVGQLLVETRTAIDTIRQLLREMSKASNVPIEPLEQTRLLDACSACPGVIGGGVPGAGGFDAIYLLVIDTPENIAVNAVEKVWACWTEMSVCPLSARQSDGGLCLEDVNSVRGLKAALER